MAEHEKLVERVAKAIYQDRNGTLCKPWNAQPKAHRDPYRSDARAAIAECYRTLMGPNNFMVAATIGHRMNTSIGGQNDWYADGEKLIKAAITASPLNANTESKP